MGIFSTIGREFNYLKNLIPLLRGVKNITSDSTNLMTDDLEKLCDTHAVRPAFTDGERDWTYRQFESYANQVARWAVGQNYQPGDTVAVFAGNRMQYVAIWFGLSKVGVVPALVNFHLKGKALAHCLNISEPRGIIVDADLQKAWVSAQKSLDSESKVDVWAAFGEIDGAQDFDRALKSQATTRPARSRRAKYRAGDMLMKMFTSGTTGLPKVAKVTHARAQRYFRAFAICVKSKPEDRMLMPLPLYHATGGLCGVGAALNHGGSVIVLNQFSASGFWDEARKHKATMFTYVGEVCRFLINVPPRLDDKEHTIRAAIGNGMGKDVWEKLTARFGVDLIVEFYGATEGNVSLINVGGEPGSIGRLPSYMKNRFNLELIQYDVENDTHPRGEDGYCIPCEAGEPGEAIGEIRPDDSRFAYEGYGDKKATEKKILRDVFTDGDAWFRTGDLLMRDDVNWYYFVDRVGDTYRWMAENVSTNEVAKALSGVSGVEIANVYGVEVPGYGGRAGMAALDITDGFKISELYTTLSESLPDFARPVFLRLQDQHDTTGTFKLRKVDLVKQGFDPAKIKDKLYVADHSKKTYVKLTAKIFEQIQAQDFRV